MRRRVAFGACVGIAAAALGLVALPALGGDRRLALDVEAHVERVGGDTIPPFAEPAAGDAVLYRVAVRNLGPATAARGELVLTLVASAEMTVRGRRGWRCDPPVSKGQLRCANSGVTRKGDLTSVLVRVPASGDRLTLHAATTVNPRARTGLRVRGDRDRTTLLVDTALWTGNWSWTATMRGNGRMFQAPTPMQIAQENTTVCALWSFSGGGIAKGTTSGEVWTARWRDGYGSGTWTLTVAPDGTFDGVQTVQPRAGGPTETYDIVGTRQSRGGTLRCADVTV